MKTIKYVGHADTRKFVKADFERHGIEDASAVTFSQNNNWTNEVSDEVAEFLLADSASFKEDASGKKASTRSRGNASVDTPGPESEPYGGGGVSPTAGVGASTVGGSTAPSGGTGGSTA